jgi:hypothetical protein
MVLLAHGGRNPGPDQRRDLPDQRRDHQGAATNRASNPATCRRGNDTARRIAVPAILGLALAAGCSMAPRQMKPEVDPATLSDGSFFYYLAELPVVTVDETYRAMLILADGEDSSRTFDERRDKLVQRGIVNPAWDMPGDYVIDRGSVAAMICKVCRIKGGVNMMLFGAAGLGDRRYAARELAYLEMLSEGPDYAPIRGGELIGVITKADAYMAEHKIYEADQLELGTEEEAASG